LKKITPRSQVKTSLVSSAKRIDPSNLRSDFDSWPSLAERSWNTSSPPILDRSYETILFAGLGGSGIIGEVIADLVSEVGSARVEVWKDYHLPSHVDKETLVVGVSCSGNTEETISVVYEANKRGLDICTFGTGGFLESFSKSNGKIKFTKTEMLKVPRSSFPGIFFPVLKFAAQNGYLGKIEGDVPEALKSLGEAKELCSGVDLKTNQALQIGIRLSKSSLPLIYSSRRSRAVGLRFRQSLNENAKMHGYDGVVPELCHNEIVAWDASRVSRQRKKSRTPSSLPILLRFEDDPKELEARFDIIEEIISGSGAETVSAPSLGSSYLSRVVSMLYLMDYSTYFAAILRRVDPILTPSIDLLKGELKKRLDYLGKLAQ
jgi:glucose/mannose-6-phosphate isomerase